MNAIRDIDYVFINISYFGFASIPTSEFFACGFFISTFGGIATLRIIEMQHRNAEYKSGN